MVKFSALLLLVLLSACDQGPLMKCDYCRTARYGVQRFMCDKCSKPHAACDAEKSILHYVEGGKTARGFVYYSATGILTCPAPPEDSADSAPVSEKPGLSSVEPPPEDPKQFTATQRGGLVALTIMISLFLGYGIGKARHGQLIKLENRKGVVS